MKKKETKILNMVGKVRKGDFSLNSPQTGNLIGFNDNFLLLKPNRNVAIISPSFIKMDG